MHALYIVHYNCTLYIVHYTCTLSLKSSFVVPTISTGSSSQIDVWFKANQRVIYNNSTWSFV